MRVSRRATCDRYYLLKLFGYGIFIHRLHKSEEPHVYHNHPWNGFSIVFGSYFEQKLGQEPKKRSWWNKISAKEFHRVDIIQPVYTLFFHGQRYNEWAVLDTKKDEIRTAPWRDVGNPEVMAY